MTLPVMAVKGDLRCSHGELSINQHFLVGVRSLFVLCCMVMCCTALCGVSSKSAAYDLGIPAGIVPIAVPDDTSTADISHAINPGCCFRPVLSKAAS